MDPPTELLTEQEAAVYDRQIRVWGVDAQRKLSKARVLVVGMSGVIAETCKNIVLAGVGSLTLVDDSKLTLEASASNFLIQFDELEGQGITLAEACAASLRDYNPMVQVKAEAGSIQNKPDTFFGNFDAIILGRSSISLRKHVNELCRKQGHRIGFYSVDCRGTCGSLFVDLKSHSYVSKRAKDDKDARHELTYPSLEEAYSVPWKSFPKRTSKLLFALRCLEDFEHAEGRQPGHVSSQDLPALLAFWKAACEAQKVAENLVPEPLFQRLLGSGSSELPPVCAILGGIVGQELIKAMSGKGEPLKNFFFFDAADGKGIIEVVASK
jgi:ubiquitin-like 1-activating enzyme E1 A